MTALQKRTKVRRDRRKMVNLALRKLMYHRGVIRENYNRMALKVLLRNNRDLLSFAYHVKTVYYKMWGYLYVHCRACGLGLAYNDYEGKGTTCKDNFAVLLLLS